MGNCRDDATWAAGREAWQQDVSLEALQARLEELRRASDPRIEAKALDGLDRVRIEGAGDAWEGSAEDALDLLGECGAGPCAPAKVFEMLHEAL